MIMAKSTVAEDPETKHIEMALEMLLTSDGKGRVRKAIALSELCCTINPNKLRVYIKSLIDNNTLI